MGLCKSWALRGEETGPWPHSWCAQGCPTPKPAARPTQDLGRPGEALSGGRNAGPGVAWACGRWVPPFVGGREKRKLPPKHRLGPTGRAKVPGPWLSTPGAATLWVEAWPSEACDGLFSVSALKPCCPEPQAEAQLGGLSLQEASPCCPRQSHAAAWPPCSTVLRAPPGAGGVLVCAVLSAPGRARVRVGAQGRWGSRLDAQPAHSKGRCWGQGHVVSSPGSPGAPRPGRGGQPAAGQP